MKDYLKTVIFSITVLGSSIFGLHFIWENYLKWNKSKFTGQRYLGLFPRQQSNNGARNRNRLIIRRNLDTLSDDDWENVGKVKKLWVYPIKSCAPLCAQEVTMDKLGPKIGQARDRSLLIIDEKGEMVTGRKVSATVLITSEYDCENNIITLYFPNLQPLKLFLSFIELEGELCKGKVWKESVAGIDCGDEVADWLRLALGLPCRMLYHGNLVSSRSTASMMSEYPLMNSDDNSLYGDLCGCMLMSESSLNDLHMKAQCKIYAENFRGNILVEGSEPYDEDYWTYLKIGEAVFRNVKPCDRCIFTTIDFKTGKRDKNMEPLKTLKKYRCISGKQAPQLGINLAIDRVGKVKVGDSVLVLRA